MMSLDYWPDHGKKTIRPTVAFFKKHSTNCPISIFFWLNVVFDQKLHSTEWVSTKWRAPIYLRLSMYLPICVSVNKKACIFQGWNDTPIYLYICIDLSIHLPYYIKIGLKCLFVLRFYGPVNPMGSCRARSVYLTSRSLGRLSPPNG